jgi:hypothetical protein
MSTTQESHGCPDSTPFEDHYLSARDVCSNCYSLIRIERVDPMRGGLVQELDSHLARRRKSTSVEFAPHAPPTDSKGVFCECGVESARERIWSDGDVDADRFRELTKNVLRTAELKDITLKAKETAAYAIQRRKDGASVDQALATGIEAGIVASVAGD